MKQAPAPMALMFLSATVLSACNQSKPGKITTATVKPKSVSPQTMMVRVSRQAQSCWFKKKDPALKPYKIASELDSYSGKPRILIVPRNKPTGLPKLVAQAERIGGKTRFTTFGPLLSSKDGARLNASLNAWARGSKSC